MKKGISIIICCYNSGLRLPDTLKYIARQEFSQNILSEVIIVDNCSTDNTATISKSIWDQFDTNHIIFRFVTELTPGLQSARIKGAKEASYEYIIFCDDDNWLSRDYVENAYKTISKDDKYGAAGGHNQGYTGGDFPDWFEENASNYAVGKQSKSEGMADTRGFIWGAGMVTKKSLFLKLNEIAPSLLTDRYGTQLSSGGDAEYCQRLILAGYHLYYSPKLILQHYIPQSRLSADYYSKLVSALNQSQFCLSKYYQASNLKAKSSINKVLILFKSFARYSLGFIFKKWDQAYEARNIYYLTKLQIKPDQEAVVIRKFYKL